MTCSKSTLPRSLRLSKSVGWRIVGVRNFTESLRSSPDSSRTTRGLLRSSHLNSLRGVCLLFLHQIRLLIRVKAREDVEGVAGAHRTKKAEGVAINFTNVKSRSGRRMLKEIAKLVARSSLQRRQIIIICLARNPHGN